MIGRRWALYPQRPEAPRPYGREGRRRAGSTAQSRAGGAAASSGLSVPIDLARELVEPAFVASDLVADDGQIRSEQRDEHDVGGRYVDAGVIEWQRWHRAHLLRPGPFRATSRTRRGRASRPHSD